MFSRSELCDESVDAARSSATTFASAGFLAGHFARFYLCPSPYLPRDNIFQPNEIVDHALDDAKSDVVDLLQRCSAR